MSYLFRKCLIFLLVFIAAFGCTLKAQEIWGLEKCVNHAIEKSLQVEGSLLTLDNADVDVSTSRQSRYPSLSASTNVGWNFGRTIDPTNNQFITETFFNNGFGLNSNVVLFNGSKINNSIDQSIVNVKASLKDLEQTKRDITLNVSTLYLNILFAKENLVNAERQLKLTLEQLSQLNKQISVGNRPENDVLDIEAQIAANEQSIVEAKNSHTINLLNLKQLLRLDPDYNMDIVAPKDLPFGTDPDFTSFNDLYAAAIVNQAGIAANELRLKSAELERNWPKLIYIHL
ncbi:MAG: TolC family protein [Saprospiraceae bacterium]|nr:TolC family protein [Saprospiraceae bacterium]